MTGLGKIEVSSILYSNIMIWNKRGKVVKGEAILILDVALVFPCNLSTVARENKLFSLSWH